MTAFKTLLWLEYRHSRVWAAALIGSLAFWAWGLHQVRAVGGADQLIIRSTILLIAATGGALVLCLMIGRIRSETRHGQYQVLLLTPPSGYMHVLARCVFAVAVAAIYYVIIAGLFWWTWAQAGVRLDAGSVAQLLLVVPFYWIGVVVAPALAWTLLLIVFVSAYRTSKTGWIPGTVMVLWTPFVFRWYMEWLTDISYTLPGWRLLEGVALRLTEILAQREDIAVTAVIIRYPYTSVPQEPLWGMLLLTLLLLALAGRIWQEVEG